MKPKRQPFFVPSICQYRNLDKDTRILVATPIVYIKDPDIPDDVRRERLAWVHERCNNKPK